MYYIIFLATAAIKQFLALKVGMSTETLYSVGTATDGTTGII